MSDNMDFNEIIIDKIVKSLKNHMFSHMNLPKEICITTLYDECRQEIKIDFKDVKAKTNDLRS